MRATTSYRLEDALAARENRDAFFRKGLEYLAANSIAGALGKRSCRFHWNVNLYVEMMSKCNGRCAFCINRVKYDRTDIPDVRYIEKLEAAIRLTRFLDPSIQLVGGEPTIFPRRLRAVCELIEKYRLRKPVITSNGSGLVENPGLLDDIEPRLAHLNISRHHDDDQSLNAIMGFVNPLTNTVLAGLLRTHRIAPRIRLNCCLLASGIAAYKDVERYLAWALELGVANVCFSTLSNLPADYFYSDEVVRQSRENAVDFAAIMRAVAADPRFRFVKFHSGSHCMYEVWQYTRDGRSCAVVFATSNNHFAEELDRVEDLFELLVFHAEGVLAGSWNRNCKKILD
jgi:molybdenum cofactor biosynthesis enzyme MoaA